MRTVWKGALSFGLVNVPIRLVATTQSTRVSFRQLHAEDRAPIKQERRCTRDGEIVPYSEVVKGVEVGKDQFVVLTDEEIEAAEPESSRVLHVAQFVSATDVNPVLVDKSYAMAPEPGGERAYKLLHDALARRGERAVGRLTLRNREHPVAVRAGDALLFADVLHYPEEVRDLTEIERTVQTQPEVTEEELELADLLMDRLHKPWDPGKYEDEYSKRIRDIVAAKARGETIEAPSRAPPARTDDLLAALRATLEQQGSEEEAEAA